MMIPSIFQAFLLFDIFLGVAIRGDQTLFITTRKVTYDFSFGFASCHLQDCSLICWVIKLIASPIFKQLFPKMIPLLSRERAAMDMQSAFNMQHFCQQKNNH